VSNDNFEANARQTIPKDINRVDVSQGTAIPAGSILGPKPLVTGELTSHKNNIDPKLWPPIQPLSPPKR
jgi:hypothetical protein